MTEFTPEWIAKARNACILFGEPATTEFRKALDHIEQLQKRVDELEEQQRWIPVSESLPELFHPVIVSGERDQKFVNEEIAWISMFFDDGEPNWTCWHVKNVTKWRPYQPPESEEE